MLMCADLFYKFFSSYLSESIYQISFDDLYICSSPSAGKLLIELMLFEVDISASEGQR